MLIRLSGTQTSDSAWTTTWGGICSNCDRGFPALDTISPEYFQSDRVVCAGCGSSEDIWQSVRKLAADDFAWFMGLPALGARQTMFSFDLAPGGRATLDFTEHGVPEDALILSVGYTPMGSGCFPMESRGNDARARLSGTKVAIYGRPTGPEQTSVQISASVVWVSARGEPESWLMLADAFEMAAQRRYSRVLVPAHSAFEIGLSRLVRDFFRQFVGADRVDRFMVDNLTASASLSVVLPVICGVHKVRPLNDEIRGKLSRLRGLRNKVVHDGLGDEDVDRKEIWECLCAAVFGFEYVRYLRKTIGEMPTV